MARRLRGHLIQVVMMMTQWGLGQEGEAARAKSAARAAAIMMTLGSALGIAMFCTGGLAKAEAHPLRVRHVTAVRYTNRVQTHHARPRSHAATASAGRPATRGASYKLAAGKSPRARSRSANLKHAPSDLSARNSTARDQRHAALALSSQKHSPASKQMSARRRRGKRYGRRAESETAAQAPVDESTRTASVADSTDAQAVTPAPDATGNKTLTVDDFVRAASALSESPAVASGVATPKAATRPVEMASVEAPPVQRESSAALQRSDPSNLGRSAPSDLVGAPLATPQQAVRTAAIRHPSRDESPNAAPEDQGLTPTHAEIAEEVEQPVVLPGLYRYGRLVVPPPMRGTREILVHQNLIADQEGLSRIQDDYDLRRMRAQRMLVDFPVSASLRVNPELTGDRRCARPWTVLFASNIARAYYARFHEPLQVNSAARTVAYQLRLRHVNGNAAGTEGDVASPHLTGEALDFGKHGMSTAEIAWMRLYLQPLMRTGKLDVEEEFQQACFHISVYRAYSNLPSTRRHPYTRSELAQLRVPRAPKDTSRTDPDQ